MLNQLVVRTGLTAVAVALMISPSAASTITLDFDLGAPNFVSVDSYYAGGTTSNSIGPGPDYGVTFVGAQTLTYDPTLQMFLPYSYGDDIIMNVADGFQDFLSFQYGWTGGFYAPSVRVWDGLNGTGNWLATIVLTNNGSYAATYQAVETLNFAGVARSAVFRGPSNYVTWDTVSFNTAAVPEPASMLLLGMGLLGGGVRRWRQKRA